MKKFLASFALVAILASLPACKWLCKKEHPEPMHTAPMEPAAPATPATEHKPEHTGPETK